MEKREFRPRLTESEMKQIRRLVDDEYRLDRRIIKSHYHSRVYPIEMQKENLKQLARLLKKLNRLLYGKYAINP